MRRVCVILAACGALLAGCKSGGGPVAVAHKERAAAPKELAVVQTEPHRGPARARECLMRAMYFESIRSSKEGLLAVGTVVMNRVASKKFPNSVCAVVGQPKQCAKGVLTKKMRGDTRQIARIADEVLSGKRHPGVKRAKFFHQAGLSFPYKNMHYVLEAGGNAFYEKRSRKRRKRAS